MQSLMSMAARTVFQKQPRKSCRTRWWMEQPEGPPSDFLMHFLHKTKVSSQGQRFSASFEHTLYAQPHFLTVSGLAGPHLHSQWRSLPCVYALFSLIKMGSMLCSGTLLWEPSPVCPCRLACMIKFLLIKSPWSCLWAGDSWAFGPGSAWLQRLYYHLGSFLAPNCVWTEPTQEDQTNPTSCSFCKTTGLNASKCQYHFF